MYWNARTDTKYQLSRPGAPRTRRWRGVGKERRIKGRMAILYSTPCMNFHKRVAEYTDLMYSLCYPPDVSLLAFRPFCDWSPRAWNIDASPSYCSVSYFKTLTLRYPYSMLDAEFLHRANIKSTTPHCRALPSGEVGAGSHKHD